MLSSFQSRRDCHAGRCLDLVSRQHPNLHSSVPQRFKRRRHVLQRRRKEEERRIPAHSRWRKITKSKLKLTYYFPLSLCTYVRISVCTLTLFCPKKLQKGEEEEEERARERNWENRGIPTRTGKREEEETSGRTRKTEATKCMSV